MRWVIFLLLAACAVTPSVEEAGFAHLSANNGRIVTLHGVRLEAYAPPPLRLKGPKHRRDRFNGVPYEISLAGFIDPQRAIIIHAERVADGSGASDYSDRAPADWPFAGFVSDGPVCVSLESGDIAGEHDLECLAANGFSPNGDFAYQQYFATTDDHNDEVVVTLIARVERCGITDSNESALAALRTLATVERID